MRHSPRQFQRQLLSSFFAFTASVVLVITVYPGYSSSPAPSAKDNLRQEIQALAAKDVEGDAGRRTSFAIDLYKNNSAGLTAPEIAEIYDDEYSRQVKAKQHNLIEVFTPKNGWPIAALLLVGVAVGAALSDTLKQRATSFIKAIDDWVYGMFAGNRFYRGIALQRYRKALEDKYKDLHIPFRVNRTPLSMSEVYVPLKAAGSKALNQIDVYHAIAEHRRLMVVGQPGAGKTMLLKHIVLSYGEGRLLNLQKRPVPVLLELHRLNQTDLTEEKLVQALVDVLARNDFPKAERFVQHSLENGTLMLLLDGLDEVNSDARLKVVQRIKDLLDKHKQCRVVITCRTQVYSGEFADATNQTLEVVEFTDQQMRRFLGPWQRDMPVGKSVNHLMQTLRDRPRIMALARTPLLLTIIAYLYTDTPFVLPHSRAEFYQTATNFLLDQWQREFNRYRASDKRRVLQHLALYNQDQGQQHQQDRRSIDYAVVLEQIRGLLPSLNLKPDTDTAVILNEIVERSGLFLKIDGGDRYQFAHLTLQEYFAAAALKDSAEELVGRFRQDSSAWQEVVKLWCGIAGDSTTLIQAVYEIDTVTGFACLADAQEVDQALADHIISEFKVKLETIGGSPSESSLGIGSISIEGYGTDYTVERAFGAVAADFRPRGQAIFNFLRELLEKSPEGRSRYATADALAMTNLPQAAQVLAAQYESSPVVRGSLVRMGDIAVPELAALARQGSILALEGLYSIGTPDAAVELVRLNCGMSQTLVGTQAAFYIAALLGQPEIEDVFQGDILQSEDIRRLERSGESFAWIWSPFTHASSSNSGVILGRVAFDLVHAPIDAVPRLASLLDPRLMVPLCTVHLFNQATHVKPSDRTSLLLKDVDALLEQDSQTPGLEGKISATIQGLLEEAFTLDGQEAERWKLLLFKLPRRLQLDVLRRLVLYRQPNQSDWRNLYRTVKYDLRTGWHYCCMLLIAAGMSLMALFGVVVASKQPIILTSSGLFVLVVILFWMSLWQGLEQAFDFAMFTQLGVLGPITFGIELQRLFQNRPIWTGIESIFNALNNRAGAVAVAVGVAGVFAGVFAVAGAGVFAVAGAVAGVFAVAFAVAGTVAVAVAVAGVFAVGVAVAFAVGVAVAFAVAGAVPVAVAVAVAGAGIGIGAWRRLKLEPEKQWLKWMVILAFPCFCWLPIVMVFGTVGLHHFLKQFTLLHFSTWQQTGLVELLLVGVCGGLLQRGRWLEERARNPLQGGILEAALRSGAPK